MESIREPVSPTYERTYGGNRAFHNFFNDFSHIQDPNLRRRLALSEIDKIPFGMYHVRAVAVAGIGFFLDSYDIFAINLVITLLGVVLWQGDPTNNAATGTYGDGANHGVLPTSVSQALKTSTSAGIVIGQVLFGWLADQYGRRKMYGVELGIVLVSTLSCCLVSASQSVSFTGLMVFWRVMMGIGIGGDYPLSSVITSEFAPTRWRGAMMAAVFSMQGIGQLSAAVVALIVTNSFADIFRAAPGVGHCDNTCQIAADRCWRIIVGVGAVPAVFALYYRITIPETPRFTFEVARDVEKAAADIKAYMASQSEGEVDEIKQARMKQVASPALTVPSASWRDAREYFLQWKNGKVLIGTTLSWFFLDFAFYGLGLNNQVILQAIGYTSDHSLHDILHNNAVGTIILAVAGSLPGYWTSIFLVDTIGRKPLQVFGFSILTVIFSVLGFCYHQLNQGSLLALYVIANYFFNFGPNTTTFIVPGECYPTRYRSTAHGASAAMGKVGAILAQVISIPLMKKGAPPDCKGLACSPWIDRLMQIFALFMFSGLVVSFLIPETKGYTLEELAGERPTSYNSGRNGSIPDTLPRKWWNPFGGGRPAGFMYSRFCSSSSSSSSSSYSSHSHRGGGFSLRRRAGSAMSPDLAHPKKKKKKKTHSLWGRARAGRRFDSSTSSTAGIAAARDVEGVGALPPPGWGAGVGTDRSGTAPGPGEYTAA